MLLKKAVHLTPLGWVDSVFGGAIGGVKTVMIFWVICLTVASLPQSKYTGGARRSFVYRTYEELPRTVKLSGLMKTRARFKKAPVRPAAPGKPHVINGTAVRSTEN